METKFYKGVIVLLAVGIFCYFFFDYLKTRDITYADRVNAESREYAEKTANDIKKLDKIQEILKSAEFMAYLDKRATLTKELVKNSDYRQFDESLKKAVNLSYGDIQEKLK